MLLTAAVWQARQLLLAADPLPVLHELGGEFSLPSTRGDSSAGSPTRLSDFRGERVLINFGYTGCPDVCPTMLAKMRDIVEAFGGEGERIRPVFITLDPTHDDVDRLRGYLTYFGETFVGMTGSRSEIDGVAAQFKVFAEPDPVVEGGISHSSHIYLLDAQGRVRSTFGGNVPVPEIIAAVAALGP
jgi:protein SCO1/2